MSQPETTFHVGYRKRYGVPSAKGQPTSAITSPSLLNVNLNLINHVLYVGRNSYPKIEPGCIVQQNSIKDRKISIAKEREDNLGS
ncbi:hypothetical protein M0802_014201 [Mischocyttarus mexicanus]|nr:hypothetical protein M0802_014201 [Mischocyttarus mexicanus]